MEEVWEHHFKYYDLFQNNSDRYRQTIDYHLKELEGFPAILDTGAGTGNLTLELLRRGHKVTAIDSHDGALDILRKKCKKYGSNLKVYNMDVERLNLNPESFDGISSMFVIPFVKNNRNYFSKEMRKQSHNNLPQSKSYQCRFYLCSNHVPIIH